MIRGSGWTAILADTETRLQTGGDQAFEDARQAAVRHLQDRLAALTPDVPPDRRARLRFALLRVLHMPEP